MGRNEFVRLFLLPSLRRTVGPDNVDPCFAVLAPPITLSRAFVEELLDEGSATVAPFDVGAAPILDAAGREIIAEREAMHRLDLAGDVPAFDATAAEWALIQFYRFAQLLLSRDTAQEAITAVVGARFGEVMTPSIIYAADLFFRLVPDLFRRAREAAPDDPFVAALEQWASEWPLSSVRIPLQRPPDCDVVAGSAALWRLYVDRVIAGHAGDRWADPRVAAQIKADLGAFPDLAPAISSALGRDAVSNTSA